MDRKRRTEILIRGRREIALSLSEIIEGKYKVMKVKSAEPGLTMIKVREGAKNSLFYIGEVLITECKVYINGNLGIGIIACDDEELSYKLAVIDAAYKGRLEECDLFYDVLKREENHIRIRDEEEKNKILKTKVNFNTMEG